MKRRILVESIFPAPYRNGVIKLIGRTYDIITFYERAYDDNRNPNWFEKSDIFYVLNNKKSINKYKNILKALNDFDLTLIYDYTTLTSMKLMLKCIIHKVPYIINCDGAHITPNFVKDTIKRFFIKRARAYFASGITARNYFLRYGADEKSIYHHNFSTLYREDILASALNKEEKSQIKKELNLYCEKLVIAVGRFIPLKRYDVLIKAWKGMNTDYKLAIIGGGDERGSYEKLIMENNISNIELIDYKPKGELLKYYKAADLFVHPSSTDVWGLVINEAMAYGLPVITTDKCVAGLELIKDSENGFIIPVGNETVLAQKIDLILSNDDLRDNMARNNLEKIRPYTIENMANSQIGVIKKVLNE
ncbi:MAG: glycosyltransferase family 4 protein [Clostridiaceae bacterium]